MTAKEKQLTIEQCEHVKEAMLQLDPENDFTDADFPKEEAVRAAVGFPITPDDLGRLWTEAIDEKMELADPAPEMEEFVMVRIPGMRLEQAIEVSNVMGTRMGAKNVTLQEDGGIRINSSTTAFTTEECAKQAQAALLEWGFTNSGFVKIKETAIEG